MVAWKSAFSKTIEALTKSGLARFVDGFEYEIKANNLSADLRWFPVFLKMQSAPARLLEMAEFEYLRCQAFSADFGLPVLEYGVLALNPSAQFLEVRHQLSELQREPGLYCFVKSRGRFFEMQLSLEQALLLDLLHQERKYTRQQIVAEALEHPMKIKTDKSEWDQILASLIERGVVMISESADRLHHFA
jgi:hypothetical protein